MWNKHFKLLDDDNTVKCEHCGQSVKIGYKNLMDHLTYCKKYEKPKYTGKLTLEELKSVFNGLFDHR